MKLPIRNFSFVKHEVHMDFSSTGSIILNQRNFGKFFSIESRTFITPKINFHVITSQGKILSTSWFLFIIIACLTKRTALLCPPKISRECSSFSFSRTTPTPRHDGRKSHSDNTGKLKTSKYKSSFELNKNQ